MQTHRFLFLIAAFACLAFQQAGAELSGLELPLEAEFSNFSDSVRDPIYWLFVLRASGSVTKDDPILKSQILESSGAVEILEQGLIEPMPIGSAAESLFQIHLKSGEIFVVNKTQSVHWLIVPTESGAADALKNAGKIAGVWLSKAHQKAAIEFLNKMKFLTFNDLAKISLERDWSIPRILCEAGTARPLADQIPQIITFLGWAIFFPMLIALRLFQFWKSRTQTSGQESP